MSNWTGFTSACYRQKMISVTQEEKGIVKEGWVFEDMHKPKVVLSSLKARGILEAHPQGTREVTFTPSQTCN
jgi:hypothetical protein